jgi:hypothetical protein
MKKSIFILILLTLFAGSAYTQDVRYMGPSNATAQGNEGILGFNALCQATCNGCQFCTSGDILRSGSLPAPPGPNQWVAPTVLGITTNTSQTITLDITGLHTGIFGPNGSTGLSCNAWATNSNTFIGLFMTPKGGFSADTCDKDLPAACCKITSEERKGK